MHLVGLRLRPGQDLRGELDAFAHQQSLQAGCIVTCVGSLTRAVMRFANQPHETTHEGPFEIVSLTGTLSVHGSHMHLAIADSAGQTLGGHLLKGSLIYTTAEVVIGIVPDVSFRREYDALTGYRELTIFPHA
ncbi:MAG: PPC domain-containing DNA-binding protein [Elainellaceae cyanobacterium]